MRLLTRNNYLLNIFNYKLYKYTNKTYIRFVEELVNNNDLRKSKIKISYFDKFRYNSKFYNETFCVTQDGNIEFLHKQNLIRFEYSNRCKIDSVLNINIKNQKTYELIKVLELLQKNFLVTNNITDIKYIQHEDILQMHKKLFNTFLSKPIISLILNNTKFRDKNNNIFELSYLTPKKYFLNYIKVKQILKKYPLATDEVIKENLKSQFNIDISCVQVFKIRKKYFIPNRFNRLQKDCYENFEHYFSKPELLINENLSEYKNIGAVYELINISSVKYTYKYTSTIYIGSTSNLYKRLNEYINSKGHTLKMKNYLETNPLYFRQIRTKNYKVIENLLLNEFIESFGELPLLNTNNSKIFS